LQSSFPFQNGTCSNSKTAANDICPLNRKHYVFSLSILFYPAPGYKYVPSEVSKFLFIAPAKLICYIGNINKTVTKSGLFTTARKIQGGKLNDFLSGY